MTNASPIKMTYSAACRILASASKISPSQVTEQHLDVLQMQDLAIDVRVILIEASDDLRDGRSKTSALSLMAKEWNDRCGQAVRQ